MWVPDPDLGDGNIMIVYRNPMFQGPLPNGRPLPTYHPAPSYIHHPVNPMYQGVQPNNPSQPIHNPITSPIRHPVNPMPQGLRPNDPSQPVHNPATSSIRHYVSTNPEQADTIAPPRANFLPIPMMSEQESPLYEEDVAGRTLGYRLQPHIYNFLKDQPAALIADISNQDEQFTVNLAQHYPNAKIDRFFYQEKSELPFGWPNLRNLKYHWKSTPLTGFPEESMTMYDVVIVRFRLVLGRKVDWYTALKSYISLLKPGGVSPHDP